MKNKCKTNKQKKHSTSESTGVLHACVFGTCIGIFSTVILLLACTFICLFSQNPDALISPLALCSSVISHLIAGFAASKKKKAALPCGLLSGAMLAAVFFLLSLFLNKTLSWGLPLPVSMLIRLSFIAVSLLGAILGTNTHKKRHSRKRK